jgi:hypothetical protein
MVISRPTDRPIWKTHSTLDILYCQNLPKLLWWWKHIGAKVWPNAECTWLMMKACGADVMQQAEKSGGTQVESQAFWGVGKRRLSGVECTRFQGVYCGESGHWRTLGFTANCRQGLAYTAEGLWRSGGSTKGSGTTGPEAEAAVGYLSKWPPEKYTDWRASEGWRAECEGSRKEHVCGIGGRVGVRDCLSVLFAGTWYLLGGTPRTRPAPPRRCQVRY